MNGVSAAETSFPKESDGTPDFGVAGILATVVSSRCESL